MKEKFIFELKRLPRKCSDNDIFNELNRVAKLCNKDTITTHDLAKYGKIHPSTIIRKFGTWNNAIIQAGLKKGKRYSFTKEEILFEMKNIAKKLDKETITIDDFDLNSKLMTSAAAERAFGGWLNALKKAGLKPSRLWGVTDEEYFENLESVWRSLGKQPYYSEMTKSVSKYTAKSYEKRFGSWTKALQAFIEYVNQEEKPNSAKTQNEKESNDNKLISKNVEITKHKTNRVISLRMRFQVLQRDNFKCRICGRNPADDKKIKLHVDHIIPWSKGGETVIDNLQTLCESCNLGKGNLNL